MRFFADAPAQVKRRDFGSASSSRHPDCPVRLQPGTGVGSGNINGQQEEGSRATYGVSGQRPDGDAFAVCPESASVLRAVMFVARFDFLPADRRVADELTEAMRCLHAQRDAHTEATT
jgi:hypothetical protein